MPSVVLLWNDSGPPGGHQQHLIQGELGQFHAIDIACLFIEMGQLEAIGCTTFEQLWAISKTSALSGYRPPPCHQHYLPLLRDGPTQSYWQHGFRETMGHQQAISSI